MADQHGVTLVEILVVLGIISIMSAVAYPPLRSWYVRASLNAEVANLVSWLHRAKSEAVKTDGYVVVKAKKDGYLIFVDQSDVPAHSGDWQRQSEEKQLVDYKLKDGFFLDDNFTKDRMRFSPRAGIKAGRFILKDIAGNQMEVIVSIIGRIRVE